MERAEPAGAFSAFSDRAARCEHGLENQRSLVYAMLQFPDAESGEEKCLGASKAAGGGEVRFGAAAIAMSYGGFGAGATATALGFSVASGGRFTDGQVSTVHKLHN